MAIKLEKDQKINLAKENGVALSNFCVGVNWGCIETKGFFGVKKEAVDLDASIGVFDHSKGLVEKIYFGRPTGQNGGIQHGGDDLTGDMDGDDGLDNEVITVDLTKLDEECTKLAVVLNSFRGHYFDQIPFASVRIYEGTKHRVDNVIATFNIAKDTKFAGTVSMIMGVFNKTGQGWQFKTIGEATKDSNLEMTLRTVAAKYLD